MNNVTRYKTFNILFSDITRCVAALKLEERLNEIKKKRKPLRENSLQKSTGVKVKLLFNYTYIMCYLPSKPSMNFYSGVNF